MHGCWMSFSLTLQPGVDVHNSITTRTTDVDNRLVDFCLQRFKKLSDAHVIMQLESTIPPHFN